MNLKFKIFTIVIFSIIYGGYNTFAQNVDSLISKIKTEKNDTSLVKLYLGVADYYCTTNKIHKTSIQYADTALLILEKLEWKKGEIMFWIKYGKIARNFDYSYYAIEYYKNALNISDNINDKQNKAYILNRIAQILREADNYSESIKFYLKAITTAEENNNLKTKLYALNGIGNNYFMLNNFTEAYKYLDKALKLAIKLDNKTSIAINYNNLGEVYAINKKYDQAEKYYAKSLKINLDYNNEKGISINNSSLGKLFYQQEKYYQAYHFFKKSLKIEKNLNNDFYLSQAYIYLGKTYTKLENYKSAEELLKKGLKIANNIYSKANKKEAYKGFADLYIAQENYEQAYFFLEEYIFIKDSLINTEVQTNTMALQLEYDFESAKQKVVMLEAQNEFEHQKNIRNIIISVVSFLSILGIIIIVITIKQSKLRKKNNTDLEAHLHEKEILIAEIHHRVKNNLAIISGLLALQAINLKDNSVFNARNILKDTQIRIHTFALIHEEVYHNEKHSEIKFDKFLKQLSEKFYFKEKSDNIVLKITTKEIKLNLNIAVSLGLIVKLKAMLDINNSNGTTYTISFTPEEMKTWQ